MTPFKKPFFEVGTKKHFVPKRKDYRFVSNHLLVKAFLLASVVIMLVINSCEKPTQVPIQPKLFVLSDRTTILQNEVGWGDTVTILLKSFLDEYYPTIQLNTIPFKLFIGDSTTEIIELNRNYCKFKVPELRFSTYLVKIVVQEKVYFLKEKLKVVAKGDLVSTKFTVGFVGEIFSISWKKYLFKKDIFNVETISPEIKFNEIPAKIVRKNLDSIFVEIPQLTFGRYNLFFVNLDDTIIFRENFIVCSKSDYDQLLHSLKSPNFYNGNSKIVPNFNIGDLILRAEHFYIDMVIPTILYDVYSYSDRNGSRRDTVIKRVIDKDRFNFTINHKFYRLGNLTFGYEIEEPYYRLTFKINIDTTNSTPLISIFYGARTVNGRADQFNYYSHEDGYQYNFVNLPFSIVYDTIIVNQKVIMVKDQVYCGDIERETSGHSGMSYWVSTNSYVYEYYKKNVTDEHYLILKIF
ncbi:MAG: hypothetical protein CH6_3595 [Candidatus Kapaibacterium sp.]|nr:MAG: hypothetical protein CH6_3595 [Candidatus Kapabacteria bacterium]